MGLKTKVPQGLYPHLTLQIRAKGVCQRAIKLLLEKVGCPDALLAAAKSDPMCAPDWNKVSRSFHTLHFVIYSGYAIEILTK